MARRTIHRSSAPLYPEHPPAEHHRRVRRARQIMRDDQLDALVLARNVTVFYMTGSRFVFVGMDAPTALAPQSMAIITQDADIYGQRFGPFDHDDVAVHTTLSTSLECYDTEVELVDILRDYGLTAGNRIGMEWGAGLCLGINPLRFLRLKDRLESELGLEIVDGTPSIWKLMAIKSPLEIERMRRAVQAAAEAMERIYDVIEVGMTEREVSSLIGRFMLEAGADGISHAQVMASGDGDLHFRSCDPLDRPIDPGWVNLDIGCTYRRYASDLNRGIFLGRTPTDDELRLYACRTGINDLLDTLIKPGVAMDEVIAEVQAYVARQGCMMLEMGGQPFLGHGIGLEAYQPPNLVPSAMQPAFQDPDGKVRFEEGMMVTYEMPVQMPGGEMLPDFNTEDNVVVTANGVENMNAMLSREVRVKL